MHIVLTVNSPWNILNFRSGLVKALLSDGHQITVVAPDGLGRIELEALGCGFVPLKMDIKGQSPAQDFALMRRMRKIFNTLKPNIVLSYTIKNNVYGAMAAKSLGIPFIPNVTGLGTAFLSTSLLRKGVETLYKHAFRKCPVVFFQNSDDRTLFLDKGLIETKQARTLPGSGIDLAKFAPQPFTGSQGMVRFLMIARLIRDKGILEFVQAAEKVRETQNNTSFQILGAAAVENRTAIPLAEIERWQDQGIIEYLGEADNVRPYVAEADVVVLPSYREGAPRTLIEAAAMARPLIATDVPGCRHVIDVGKTGLLCRARDTESLAETMLEMIAIGSDARIEMGRLGRIKMEAEYDEQHIIRAYREMVSFYGKQD